MTKRTLAILGALLATALLVYAILPVIAPFQGRTLPGQLSGQCTETATLANDGTMSNANWYWEQRNASNPANVVGYQSAGGNPGSYRHVVHFASPTPRLTGTFNKHTGFVNPARVNAATVLTMTIDSYFTHAETGGELGVSFVLWQGNNRYEPIGWKTVVGKNAWLSSSHQITGAQMQAAGINLSPNAAPIYVGFGSVHSWVGTNAIRFDNFRVTASGLCPQPASSSSQPQPFVDIKINGQDGTVSAADGSTVTLSWTSSGVTSCNTGTSNMPGWGSYESLPTSGSRQVTVTQGGTFGIQCAKSSDTNQIVQDSVAASVSAVASSSASSLASAEFRVTGQNGAQMDSHGTVYVPTSDSTVILDWNVQSASSCYGSTVVPHAQWDNDAQLPAQGSRTVSNPGTQSFYLNCAGQVKRVNVVVYDPAKTQPVGVGAAAAGIMRAFGESGEVSDASGVITIAPDSTVIVEWNIGSGTCYPATTLGSEWDNAVGRMAGGIQRVTPGGSRTYSLNCGGTVKSVQVVMGTAAASSLSSAVSSQSGSIATVAGPSVCTTVCGDGIVIAPEQCDDGNAVDNDECSNTCTANFGICVPGSVCPNGALCPENGVCPGSCTPGSVCPSGDICPANGLCPNACVPGTLCPNDAVCPENGLCPGACLQGTTCPDGSVCPENGLCPNACTPGTLCPTGAVCPANGICPNACTPGTLCPDNSVCPQNGICPMQCIPGTLCPTGDICPESGICPMQCIPGTLCPTGDICPESGMCPGICVPGSLCPSGDICPANGLCPVNCQPGTLCPSGDLCPANGVCPQQCAPGSLCPSGALCTESGVCPDISFLACQVNADCSSNLCLGGYCSCADDSQCGEGNKCVAGLCASLSFLSGDLLSLGSCASDGDCPGGMLCRDGLCGADPALCGNGALDPGELCDDGNDDETDSCSSDCLLGDDMACTSPLQCRTLICTDGRCGRCTDDNQCPDDMVCVEGGCIAANPAAVASNNILIPSELAALLASGTGFSLFQDGTTYEQYQAMLLQRGAPHAPVGNTGPETVAVLAAGASAGYAWVSMRRKRKR